MIRCRSALSQDLGKLTLLESKTQEFPLTIDEVKEYMSADRVYVFLACIGEKEVGYVMFTVVEAKRYLDLYHIGVLGEYRRKGVSSSLLKQVIAVAKKHDLVYIRMLVPSYTVDDKDDPWNIEHWLWINDFSAKGLFGVCNRYGKDYDWYLFKREL